MSRELCGGGDLSLVAYCFKVMLLKHVTCYVGLDRYSWQSLKYMDAMTMNTIPMIDLK